MTRVSVSGYNERLYLEAVGHSVAGDEFAATGAIERKKESERVCAAVSILMLSAASRLREMDSNGDFVSACITVESGYALFDIEPREDARERVEEIIEMTVCGISLLEEGYPELVSLV